MANEDYTAMLAQALMAPPSTNTQQYLNQGRAMPWNNYQVNTPNFNFSTQNPGGMSAYYGGGFSAPFGTDASLSLQGGYAPTDKDKEVMMKYTRRF